MDVFAAAIADLVNKRAAVYERLQTLGRAIDIETAKGETLTQAITALEKTAPPPGRNAAARLNIVEAVAGYLAGIGRTEACGITAICRVVGRKPSQVIPVVDKLIAAGRISGDKGGRYYAGDAGA